MTRISICLLVVAAVFILGTSVADARDFNCDASAVRLTLGGQATVEPITANRGQSACKEVRSQTKPTIALVTTGALPAETGAPKAPQAAPPGGLGGFSVSADALAAFPPPPLDAIAQLPPVPLP